MNYTRILTGAIGVAIFLFGCLLVMGQVGRRINSYAPGGTDVPITDGGTGASTATAGFDALAPGAETKGSLILADGSDYAELGIGSTDQVLTVVGGTAAWAAASAGGAPMTLTPGGATLPNTNFAALNKKTGTNKTILRLDFDDDNGTDQCVYWERPALASNASSVNFDIAWMADAATGTTVEFDITQDGTGNDEVWDAAGTTVTITDTLIATTDTHYATVAGTIGEWQANESVNVKLCLDEDQGDLADVVSVLWLRVRVE